MKVGGIDPAIAHNIELAKLTQQQTIKQQQLKVIEDRQEEIKQMRPKDSDKGANIDEMV
jgi:hypothetical protein